MDQDKKCGPCGPDNTCEIKPKCLCFQPPLQKVYEVRIDSEDEGDYVENMTSYTILARSFDDAILMAKERMRAEGSEEDVIGNVTLVAVID